MEGGMASAVNAKAAAVKVVFIIFVREGVEDGILTQPGPTIGWYTAR